MTTSVQTSVDIVRKFDAPVDKVFKAWTDEAMIKKWFAPTEEYMIHIDEFFPRLGGRYRFIMEEKNGTKHIVTGVYEEFEKPNLLGFTWAWEGKGHYGHNRVTVEFKKERSSTVVKVNHGFFLEQEKADQHEKCWNGSLDRLAKCL